MSTLQERIEAVLMRREVDGIVPYEAIASGEALSDADLHAVMDILRALGTDLTTEELPHFAASLREYVRWWPRADIKVTSNAREPDASTTYAKPRPAP